MSPGAASGREEAVAVLAADLPLEKRLEAGGWALGEADATFELRVTSGAGGDAAPFHLTDPSVAAREPAQGQDGPAGIRAVGTVGGAQVSPPRWPLVPRFLQLATVPLIGHLGQVIDGENGTAATVRVGIDSTAEDRVWATGGCLPQHPANIDDCRRGGQLRRGSSTPVNPPVHHGMN